jgi:hypothetical protein
MLHDAGIFTVPASTGRGQYRMFLPHQADETDGAQVVLRQHVTACEAGVGGLE